MNKFTRCLHTISRFKLIESRDGVDVGVAGVGSDETHADRRERYERVLSAIAHNSSADPDNPMRPSVAEATVLVVLAYHADYDPDGVKRTIEAADQNGDVVRFHDGNNQPRLCLVDEKHLRALQAREGGRDDPDAELIGRCHRLLHELEDTDTTQRSTT